MQRRRSRNTPKLHLLSRLHWATPLIFVTNWTWRYIVHPSLLRMLFLFGWPPCQRSDITLVEVSQHAYHYLNIRAIVLFVFLRNSRKPDRVLVYIFVEQILSESESLSHQALSIISNPLVNLNRSYSPETLNSGHNWWFFLCHVTLKFDGSWEKPPA